MLPWSQVTHNLSVPSVNRLMHTLFTELLLLDALGLILDEGPSAVCCPSYRLPGLFCLWTTHDRSINSAALCISIINGTRYKAEDPDYCPRLFDTLNISIIIAVSKKALPFLRRGARNDYPLGFFLFGWSCPK